MDNETLIITNGYLGENLETVYRYVSKQDIEIIDLDLKRIFLYLANGGNNE